MTVAQRTELSEGAPLRVSRHRLFCGLRRACDHVDDWLARLFGPDGVDATIGRLAEQAAQLEDPAALTRAEAPARGSARARIAEYGAEMSNYRESFKAGADPALVAPWIAEP